MVVQKKKQDEQKPLEEKIKVLKKRNAELATIARRLEEKAKALQQENARNKAVSAFSLKQHDGEKVFYITMCDDLTKQMCH